MQSLSALPLALSVSLAGFAFASPALAGEREELKEQIVALSKANTLDAPAELPETRAALEPLVERLVALAGRDDVPTQLAKVEGAWHELWSDDREPEKPNSKLRRDTVYQVVTKSGFFYNLATSEVSIPGGPVTANTGFLRGVYTIDAKRNGIEIEFTKAGYVDGFLPAGTDLVDAIYRAETDPSYLKKLPFPLKAPRGPIGQKGFLTNVYVDGDLRIARGEAYLDGKQDLYVLGKVSTPVVTE
jgi:PAP_fibrillin